MAAFFILKDGVRKMGKTAVIFPGQGAQYVGMAKDFYDSFEDSKAVFDEAAGVLDVDLLKLCFEENDDINKTEFTQPAMVAAEAAIYEHLKNMGLEADVCSTLCLWRNETYRRYQDCKTERYPYAEYCTSRTGGNGSGYSNGR